MATDPRLGPVGAADFPPAVPGRRGLLVEAVALTAQALADGIGVDERWTNGFTYLPDSCDAINPQAIQCLGSPGDKLPPDNADAVDYAPFLTFGGDKCSRMDVGRDREGRARRNLLATESWQVEAEFFDGLASKSVSPNLPNPFLTDGTTADDATGGGSPLPSVRALARVEQAIMECLHGQRAMIHAQPELVSLWQAGGALRLEGNVLLTVLDSIVVPGSGYSGAGPDATPAAAGTSWCYGTSLVYALQGSINLLGTAPDWLNRTTNDVTVLVERTNALVFAPCCVKAVHASLTS